MKQNENISFEELIFKKLSGDITPEELSLFNSLLNESLENKQLFDEYSIVWQHSDQHNSDFDDKTEEALQKVNVIIQKKQNIFSIHHFVGISIRIAAVLIVLFGIYFFFKQTQKPNEIILTEIITKDSIQKILLPDSSIVWLNKSGKISYPKTFDNKTRTISLEGEAYFQITKNPDKPFIINAGDAVVQVLGTQFNLKAIKQNDIIVSVTEGKVAFSKTKNKEENIKLIAGEQGILNLSSNKIEKNTNFNQNATAWKTGILKFDNQTLDKVIKDLSEYYKVEIVLKDKSLSGQTVSSVFTKRDLEFVLHTLELILPIKISKNNNLIEIRAN